MTAVLLTCRLFTIDTRAAVGDIYVSEDNGNIERFTPGGVESTFATGVGTIYGLALDPSGNLFAAAWDSGTIYKFAPDGTRTTFASGLGGLGSVSGIAFDAQGNLFAAALTATSYGILKFAPDGSSTTFATGFAAVRGLTVDAGENVYISGRLLGAIPYQGFKYTSGTRSVLGNMQAYGFAVDSSGNLFAPAAPGLVKFTPDGTQSTFATLAEFPRGLAFDADGNLFATIHNAGEILKFGSDGNYETFAAGLTSLPDAIAIQVPEPSMFALLGLCVVALVVSRGNLRRRTMHLA
jgi:sugar lactone lactonase YvrE